MTKKATVYRMVMDKDRHGRKKQIKKKNISRSA